MNKDNNKFFNVVVKDRKGKYMYDFAIKAKSESEVKEKFEKMEDSIYEKASDIGIVNLASDFIDSYDEKTIKVDANPSAVRPKFKKVDVLINQSKFKIKGERLISVK